MWFCLFAIAGFAVDWFDVSDFLLRMFCGFVRLLVVLVCCGLVVCVLRLRFDVFGVCGLRLLFGVVWLSAGWCC